MQLYLVELIEVFLIAAVELDPESKDVGEKAPPSQVPVGVSSTLYLISSLLYFKLSAEIVIVSVLLASYT